MFCTNCGYSISAGSVHCPSCAAPVAAPPVVTPAVVTPAVVVQPTAPSPSAAFSPPPVAAHTSPSASTSATSSGAANPAGANPGAANPAGAQAWTSGAAPQSAAKSSATAGASASANAVFDALKGMSLAQQASAAAAMLGLLLFGIGPSLRIMLLGTTPSNARFQLLNFTVYGYGQRDPFFDVFDIGAMLEVVAVVAVLVLAVTIAAGLGKQRSEKSITLAVGSGAIAFATLVSTFRELFADDAYGSYSASRAHALARYGYFPYKFASTSLLLSLLLLSVATMACVLALNPSMGERFAEQARIRSQQNAARRAAATAAGGAQQTGYGAQPGYGYSQPGQWPLASPWKRYGANVVDNLLKLVTLWIGWFIWSCFTRQRGQSPGKQIVGLVVIDLDTNAPAEIGKMFLRDSLLKGLLWGVIGLASCGIAPLVLVWMIFWDDKHQMLWDRMANTVVVDA